MRFDSISKNILNNLRRCLKKQSNRSSVNYIQMNDMIRDNSKIILLDVRSVQEYNEGHLNGAINIPLSELKINAIKMLNKNDIIIAYCQMGKRSKKAINVLKLLGYNNVYTLEGGLDAINL